MRLIVGDKASIEYAKKLIKEKRRKILPLYWLYKSNCCKSQVNRFCDWEHPKNEMVLDYEIIPSSKFGLMSSTKRKESLIKARSGVTLIEFCEKCKKECWSEKIPVYEN